MRKGRWAVHLRKFQYSAFLPKSVTMVPALGTAASAAVEQRSLPLRRYGAPIVLWLATALRRERESVQLAIEPSRGGRRIVHVHPQGNERRRPTGTLEFDGHDQ